MKTSQTLIALTMLGFSTSFARSADDAAKEDEKLLQGTWKVTKGVSGGKEAPEDIVSNTQFAFEKDMVRFLGAKDDKNSAKFTLDAGQKPRRMSAEILDGVRKGQKRVAIYEVNGDTLKICWGKGDAFPAAFESKEDDGQIYLELKRVKK